MNEGAIEQAGTPSDIYNRPKTRFVASFVGTLNMLDGSVVDPASGVIRLGGTTIFARAPIAGAMAGDRRTVALRLGSAGDGDNALNVVVEDVSFLGAVVRLKVRHGDESLHVDTFNVGPPPRRGRAKPSQSPSAATT